MKTWLILILLLVFEVSVQAATPQLTNFNAKQFIVTPTAAPTNVIKLRLNPSQFDTNASSITITNGAGGGGTNVFNTIITTNLTVVSNLTVINNITLGGTNVAAINPTIGRYPYNQDGTNFGDGSLRWVDPTTSATETFIVDDLAGGGVVISEAASGIVTNLPAGSGALTNDGAGHIGWSLAPPGGFNPTPGTMPYNSNNVAWGDSPITVVNSTTIDVPDIVDQDFKSTGRYIQQSKSILLALGTNAIPAADYSQFLLISPDPNPANVILQLDSGYDTVQHLEIFNYTNVPNSGQFTLPANSAVPGGGFVRLLGDQDWVGTNGLGILLRFVSPDWIEIGRFNLNNGTTAPADNLWTNKAGILEPVNLTLPVEIDSQINFGPGVTNLLFRNPSNILVYSNGIPVMQALDSGGRTLEWGVQSTIPFVSGTSALELFGGTGSGLVLDSGAHAIYPVTGGVGEDLGTATKYYGSLYLTNQIVWGPGTTNVLYRESSDLTYTNINPFGTFYRVSSDGINYAYFGANGNVAKITGPIALYMQATPSANYALLSTTALSPSPSGTLSLGTSGNMWDSLYLTNQIVFGPGTTNVLYRSGSDLVYTNGATDSKFIVYNGSANGVELEAQNLTGFVTAAGASTGVGLRAGSSQALLSSDRFYPVVDLHESLGGLGQTWKETWTSNLFVRGWTDGVDYSRLAISHTGTNAWDTIRFDSQSTGIAGTAGRPFQFTNAPVMLPYVTKAEKTALVPMNGMIVYQTDNTPGLRAYINGAWVMVSTVADP